LRNVEAAITSLKVANVIGSNPVLTAKIKAMKKVIKSFHKTIEEACHPIDTFPIYLFMVIALLCPAIVKLLG
jgi:hypothetical protein